MTKKIFHSILLVASIATLSGLAIVFGCLYHYFAQVQEQQLSDELNVLTAAYETAGSNCLQTIQAEHYRITWIDTDGTVLLDTQANPDKMENHSDREEIKEAMKAGSGKSSRYSATLLEKTIYYAKRLSDKTILRISISRATTGRLALGMVQPICIVLGLSLVLSAVLASRLSKKIIKPLNALDLDHPLDNDSYEELSPLLNRIHRQHSEIQEQIEQLQKKEEEFTQITDNMNESLVLLNQHGDILNMNPAARKLFHAAEKECIGKDFLTIERIPAMSRAIKRAVSDGHADFKLSRFGRTHQIDVSRIDYEQNHIGTVILAFDITEQETAEQNRREFTANVSHELKTPLQGIIGSADLIENQMVRPEDYPRFIGHIKTEATRLIALIGDIIRLSELDEENEMPKENIDLLELAYEINATLADSAAGKGILLKPQGKSVFLFGVRQLLYEILYNLCDNAIKYNKENGTVTITVEESEDACILCVKDTGIGIASEHQNRIFERFYRVDKSHSKQSGGTGLGLSIVKHAVSYHHGKITLESEPGQGTSITVTLPKHY